MTILIIGPPRSATTLVTKSLYSHSQISYTQSMPAFGFEPFAFNLLGEPNTQITGVDDIDFMMQHAPIPGINNRNEYAETLLIWYYVEPQKSAQHVIRPFMDMVLQAMPVFKILFHQIPHYHDIWQHLIKQDIKVLLFHRNYLDLVISEQLAIKTGVWHVELNETPPKDTEITIKLDYFLKRCCFFDTYYKFHYGLWQNRLMDFYYERDIDDWDHFILRTEQFLGLNPEPLAKMYIKRTIGDVRHLIKNYDELKKAHDALEKNYEIKKKKILLL